jgi:hypothetical protein
VKRFLVLVCSSALATSTLLVALTATGSAGAQAPGCLPTSDRTVGPRGFAGLGVKRIAPVYSEALQLALNEGYGAGAAQREADALTSEGFVSGTEQFYLGRTRKAHGDQGIAETVQLGSPEQAQSEFNRTLARVARFGPWKRFTVPAIPGSRGLRQFPNRSHPDGASNLYFTDGNYAYVLGTYVARGGTGTGRVKKAATNLYNRVHGAPACP